MWHTWRFWTVRPPLSNFIIICHLILNVLKYFFLFKDNKLTGECFYTTLHCRISRLWFNHFLFTAIPALSVEARLVHPIYNVTQRCLKSFSVHNESEKPQYLRHLKKILNYNPSKPHEESNGCFPVKFVFWIPINCNCSIVVQLLYK